MPFCQQCGKPLGAADKFCQACGCKAAGGSSPPSTAGGGAAAAVPAGSASASLRAGTGPSSNRGTDRLPSEFHRAGGKYGGSEAETEAVLGSMLAETNRVFGQLGVSVGAERRAGAAGAGGEVACDECKRPIRSEAAVQAQGRTLHAGCFTCVNCATTIGSDSFVSRAGKPWCDACAAKTKAGAQGAVGKATPGAGFVTPSAAGVPPFKPASAGGNSSNGSSNSSSGASGLSPSGGKFGSTFGSSGSNNNTSNYGHGASSATSPKSPVGGGGSGSGLTAGQRDEFLSRRDAGKTYCSGCGTVMMGEGVTTPSGAVYHVGCFLCARCSLPIGGGGGEDGAVGSPASFAERDGRPFHPGCAPAAAGSGASCSTCHKPLSGKFVKASDGATHHRDCFRCAVCAGDLAAGYALRDGRPHCASCVRSNPVAARRTVNAASAPTAKDMGGIRYNHVTHEVSRVPPPTVGSPAESAFGSKSGAATASDAFCKGCGGTLGGNKFCPSCGAKA